MLAQGNNRNLWWGSNSRLTVESTFFVKTHILWKNF